MAIRATVREDSWPTQTVDEQYKPGQGALIIDNGLSEMRAGYGETDEPSIWTGNVVSKHRDRKSNRLVLLAGKDTLEENTSRANMKSAFEGDVVVGYDTIEHMLDWVFCGLNIDTPTVDRPIVMTESLANPYGSRAIVSELLFELYGAPSVAYGIDSLFSFFGSNGEGKDGIVLSSSAGSSHVIPVVAGRGIMSSAKKIPWGSTHAAESMLKTMQLKYPHFPSRLTSQQASAIYQDHSYVAVDYPAEVREFADPEKMVDKSVVVQFPYVDSSFSEKTAEELAIQAEKRKEAGRRLQEQTQRQRQEKLQRWEEELLHYEELRTQKAAGELSKLDYERAVKRAGFKTVGEMDEYSSKIGKSLKRARDKEAGIEDTEEKEPPVFTLVDVPDHTLNEADLKEKRKQRLLKASYDARIRLKAEKEHEKRVAEEEARRDFESRTGNFDGWREGVRAEHEAVIQRLKDRKKRREELNNRKSAAAQNRMKSIASLASESKADKAAAGSGTDSKGKKRKKGDDDGFGRNDEDWAVYREIGNADDSEEEEEDHNLLSKLESKLLEHDPSFTIHDTSHRRALLSHKLMNAYVRGIRPSDPPEKYADSETAEGAAQLHVSTERIRCAEGLWEPAIWGVDCAGAGEVLRNVLGGFSPSTQARLVGNVFVTGQNTLTPGFDARLEREIQPFLPVGGAQLVIRRPKIGRFDPWRGMALWSRDTARLSKASLTKQMYEEMGEGYIVEHGLGNWLS